MKNRLHLDLITTDFETELARLLSLGATELATLPGLDDTRRSRRERVRPDPRLTRRPRPASVRGDPMTSNEQPEYRPSASERARDQVARYEASDGTDGGELDGRPVVILTTRGASSGALRKTPIMRVVDGDSYIAIASYAGNPRNPAWYYNLQRRPRCRDPRRCAPHTGTGPGGLR